MMFGIAARRCRSSRIIIDSSKTTANVLRFSTKVYIDGINWKTDKETLVRLFQPFGKLESAEVGKFTANKTTGLVVYSNFEDAREAIINMNGQEHNGRELHVDFSLRKTIDDS